MNESIGTKLPRHRAGLAAAAAMATLMTAGCATTPDPTQQVAVTDAAMAHADTAGAPELAPVEMRIARQKVALMKAAMAARDYRHALWLAQEAEVDAQLAEVRAWSARASNAVTAASGADKR